MGRAPAVPTRFCRSDMPAAIQTPGLPAPASHLKPMGAPRQQRNASRRLPLHQGRPGGLAGHAAAKGGFQNMVLPWEQRGMNAWCLPRPVEHSATLRYSRMLDKDFPPPSAAASHTSGSPVVGQSNRIQNQYSNRGTRYRGFPGHEPHKTRLFSAESESCSLGRAQYRFVHVDGSGLAAWTLCPSDTASSTRFALLGCVVPLGRRPDRRCPGGTNQAVQ